MKNEIELKEGSKIQEGKPDEGEALKTFEKEGKQEVDVSVNETAATPTENIESVEEKSVSKTVESDKAKKIKEKEEGEERTTEKKEKKKKKEGNEEKAKKKPEKAANDVGVLMSIDFCSILNIIKRCKNRPPHTRQKRMTRKAQRIPHIT